MSSSAATLAVVAITAITALVAVAIVEWLVMDEPASDLVAHGRVVSCKEQVGMPELVDFWVYSERFLVGGSDHRFVYEALVELLDAGNVLLVVVAVFEGALADHTKIPAIELFLDLTFLRLLLDRDGHEGETTEAGHGKSILLALCLTDVTHFLFYYLH